MLVRYTIGQGGLGANGVEARRLVRWLTLHGVHISSTGASIEKEIMSRLKADAPDNDVQSVWRAAIRRGTFRDVQSCSAKSMPLSEGLPIPIISPATAHSASLGYVRCDAIDQDDRFVAADAARNWLVHDPHSLDSVFRSVLVALAAFETSIDIVDPYLGDDLHENGIHSGVARFLRVTLGDTTTRTLRIFTSQRIKHSAATPQWTLDDLGAAIWSACGRGSLAAKARSRIFISLVDAKSLHDRWIRYGDRCVASLGMGMAPLGEQQTRLGKDFHVHVTPLNSRSQRKPDHRSRADEWFYEAQNHARKKQVLIEV